VMTRATSGRPVTQKTCSPRLRATRSPGLVSLVLVTGIRPAARSRSRSDE
jgi:hypothetical protein